MRFAEFLSKRDYFRSLLVHSLTISKKGPLPAEAALSVYPSLIVVVARNLFPEFVGVAAVEFGVVQIIGVAATILLIVVARLRR